MRAELILGTACLSLVATGCDVVFGLVGRAPETVQGVALRSRIVSDASGLPVRTDLPFPGETFTMVVRLADGSQVDVALGDDGTFAFDRPAGSPYRIVASTDGRVIEYQHDAPQLDIRQAAFGRLDRAPVTLPTIVNLPASTTAGYLSSTGLWTQTGTMTATEIDWATATSQSGTIGLIDANRGDVLYFLDFAYDANAPAHNRLANVSVVDNLVMTDGAPVDIPAPTAAARDLCVHLISPLERDRQRLATAAATDMGTASWAIMTSADPSIGAFVLQLVAFGVVPRGSDVDVTVPYANPFRGSTPIARMLASFDHQLTYPGADPLPVRFVVTTFATFAASSDCATSIPPPIPIAIATDVTIAGRPIKGDLTEVSLDRTRDVELTWRVDDGEVDAFDVVLREVISDTNGVTATRVVREFKTVRPSVLIDPDVFTRRAYYTLQVGTTLGLPGARDGNLATYAYPFGDTSVYSGVFHIQ